MTKNYSLIVAALIGTQLAMSPVKADDTADAIAALKKQIEALTTKVDQLEKEHALEIQHPPGTLTTNLETTATNKGSLVAIPDLGFVTLGSAGFWFRSADSNFTMRLAGVGQIDGHSYRSFTPSAKDTLTIRRLRGIVSGTIYQNYDYYIQTDFASGTTATTTNNAFLQDAYVNIHYWPEFQFEAGKMKEPVGYEIQPADKGLWFVERGYPTELVPNRNVGGEFHGDLWGGALSYWAGAFNGVSDGGSGDIETGANSKDLSARIFAQPFTNTSIAAIQGIGLGVGTSYGYEGGSTLPSFATIGRQTFFTYTNGVTDNGDHFRVDPQFSYFWGPLGVFAEYADSSQKFLLNKAAAPKNTHEYFDTKAWDVSASYFLTGEKNSLFQIPSPIHPFSIHGGGLGAWQLTARVTGLDLDKAAFSRSADFASAGSAQHATTWGVGLNWYLNRGVKWIFEYDQTSFGFAPGYAPKPGTVGAQDEKVLLTRLQFAF